MMKGKYQNSRGVFRSCYHPPSASASFGIGTYHAAALAIPQSRKHAEHAHCVEPISLGSSGAAVNEDAGWFEHVGIRNVSTILRQSTVEFKLGFSAFSATAVRLVRRPAVELGGRVWPDGMPCQGWPSAPTFGG
jgi:hypothetical protein